MPDDSQLLTGAYEGGTGSALVLLHGLGGTWHIWKPVLSLLEKRHRVIAVTLPGHDGGCPLSPATEPTVAALADALIVELRTRGIASAHVAGNSLGGWLALELARRGFARSVVAFSPAGGWTNLKDYGQVARSFRRSYAWLPCVIAITSSLLGNRLLRRLLSRRAMVHGDRVLASDFRAMLQAMARTHILPALLDAIERDGPMAPLNASAAPIRIVWGAQDRVIPFDRYGHPMVQRISAAEQMMLPGVGHVPMYDDPDAVSAAILQVTTAVDSRKSTEAR